MKLIVERARIVDSSPDAAWSVISDMAGYADHVDGLAETTVVAGSELGAVRRCVDTSGAEWQETCVVWDPGSRYTVEVDVDTYPMKFRALFSAFRGSWWVAEREGRTVIGITFEAGLRRLAQPMRGQIERRIEHDLDAILESYDQSTAIA